LSDQFNFFVELNQDNKRYNFEKKGKSNWFDKILGNSGNIPLRIFFNRPKVKFELTFECLLAEKRYFLCFVVELFTSVSINLNLLNYKA
jgi:hypothetical protein